MSPDQTVFLGTNAYFSLRAKRIWVAGHTGLVGRALCRRLKSETCEVLTVTRQDLDLTNQADTHRWISDHKPDTIIVAAAKVGGIQANMNYPAAFLYDNLMIAANIVHGAYLAGVPRLLMLGSSCIYPRLAKNPITEDALLGGALEATNESYAVAKIAGLKLCETYRTQYGCDFISAMPCNLYGPHDRFDEQNSHVIPALMMRAHAAKETGAPSLEIWGSGTPRREFLYVDDAVDALVYILKNYQETQHINVGYGADITIKDLAEQICDVVGYDGALVFNTEKPDGTPQKLMDNKKLSAMEWQPKTDLKTGLRQTYQWYLENLV